MPRMGWGCKDVHLKAFSEKQSPARAQVSPLERSCNKGTRSSVNFPARAYCKSTGWVKSPLDSRSSVRRDSARAPNPPLERTVKQCRDTGCSDSPLERQFTRSSGSAKSGKPRLHLQAQNQVQMHQNQSSWAHFLENIYKHIALHVLKLNLRNQSPRVFNSNPISNHFSRTILKHDMHDH